MKNIFAFILLIGIFQLAVAQSVVVPTIEEKNKEADTAFVEWKKRTPHSGLSEHIRTMLSPEAIKYIVDESQMPFSKVLSDAELKAKVEEVAHGFIKKFAQQGAQEKDIPELRKLIVEVIKPESVFQIPIDTLEPELEGAYDTLVGHLKQYRTPVNTTLQEWALRFLTSEAIFVALPFIEKAEVEGKSFSELAPDQQEDILRQTAGIVAKRFMDNLRPVQQKFKFVLPRRVDEAMEAKLLQFLRQKFASEK